MLQRKTVAGAWLARCAMFDKELGLTLVGLGVLDSPLRISSISLLSPLVQV